MTIKVNKNHSFYHLVIRFVRLKNVEVVVNPFHLDDLVGRYIGDHKFTVGRYIDVTIKDVGYILGIPFTGTAIYVGVRMR